MKLIVILLNITRNVLELLLVCSWTERTHYAGERTHYRSGVCTLADQV